MMNTPVVVSNSTFFEPQTPGYECLFNLFRNQRSNARAVRLCCNTYEKGWDTRSGIKNYIAVVQSFTIRPREQFNPAAAWGGKRHTSWWKVKNSETSPLSISEDNRKEAIGIELDATRRKGQDGGTFAKARDFKFTLANGWVWDYFRCCLYEIFYILLDEFMSINC